MGSLADAYVDVKPNLSPLHTGLGQAKASLTSFASAGSAVVAKGLAFAGVVAGIGGIGAALFKSSMKAADLGESLSKINVTFGGAAKGMIDQADDLARKFGVVKKEALDAGAGFGLMGVAAGLSKDRSAALGREFVQLGLDIASYHNLSNVEAFTKLRAGLAGEAEPLRVLGIMLSEDAVKVEAFRMGLTKVNRDLTEQEKIMARASLIKRQAGPAVGDLERTADSAKNQWRKLQGEVENFETTVGEKLIPSLTAAVGLAHSLGKAFERSFGTGPMEAFANKLEAVMIAARLAADALGTDENGKRDNTSLASALVAFEELRGRGDSPAAKKLREVITEKEFQKEFGGEHAKRMAAPAKTEEWYAEQKDKMRFMAEEKIPRGRKFTPGETRRFKDFQFEERKRLNPFGPEGMLGTENFKAWQRERGPGTAFGLNRVFDPARDKAPTRDEAGNVLTLGSGWLSRMEESGKRIGAAAAGVLENRLGQSGRRADLLGQVAGGNAVESRMARMQLAGMGGGFGVQLLTGAARAVAGARNAPERKQFSSELMTDPEDYARKAIQASLDMRNNPQQEQVKKLEEVKAVMEKVATNTGEMLKAGFKGLGGLIPRP